jgi:hypothetical protein
MEDSQQLDMIRLRIEVEELEVLDAIATLQQ